MLPAMFRGLQRLNILAMAVIAACGLLTWTADQFWLADLTANLRLQLMIAGTITGVVAMALKQWKWTFAQTALLVMHAAWLLEPVEYAQNVTGPVDLKVTTVNVWLRNENFDDIANELRNEQSDVIAIVEISEPLLNHLRDRLADSHPHVFARPSSGAFGVALFSKTRLLDQEVVQPDVGSPSLTAKVEVAGRQYRVFATHPTAPMSPGYFDTRNRQLKYCADVLAQYRRDEPDVPVITVGDFNLTPWSPHFAEFQKASGLLLAGRSLGVQPTWYAVPTFPAGLVIDHCLVTPDLSCVDHSIGPNVGSDHLPVTVQLQRNDFPASVTAARSALPVGLATTRID